MPSAHEWPMLLNKPRVGVDGWWQVGLGLKATSHSMIFDIPTHPVCEDQRRQ